MTRSSLAPTHLLFLCLGAAGFSVLEEGQIGEPDYERLSYPDGGKTPFVDELIYAPPGQAQLSGCFSNAYQFGLLRGLGHRSVRHSGNLIQTRVTCSKLS